MENTVAEQPKKVGNPNLVPKQLRPVTVHGITIDPKKTYRFQLCQSHEDVKPKDAKTGEQSHNPYPPRFSVANEGTAYDEETKSNRHFRFLDSYQTVWVDEQQKPAPTPNQIRSEKNDIVFNEGFISIRGTQVNKIKALMVQDVYEGNENPIEHKPRIFRLIDEGKERSNIRSAADKMFEAEQAIRDASIEELLPVAMLFGISEDADQGQDWVRTQLILKAKTPPTKTQDYQKVILDAMNDPINEVKFLVSKAMRKNIISASLKDNCVVWVATDTIMLEVNSQIDVPAQVARKYHAGDEQAAELIQMLKDHR